MKDVRAWWVWAWVAAGCGSEQIAVVVEAGDPPSFRWDGDNVHDVLVWRCQSDCDQTECGRIVPFEGGASAVWQAGVSGEDPSKELPIASPLTYGEPEVPGDEKHVEPTPLEPGGVYAVEVFRYGNCMFGGDDCTRFDAHGCTVFVQR